MGRKCDSMCTLIDIHDKLQSVCVCVWNSAIVTVQDDNPRAMLRHIMLFSCHIALFLYSRKFYLIRGSLEKQVVQLIDENLVSHD